MRGSLKYLVLICLIIVMMPIRVEAKSWYDYKIIRHAGGSIKGKAYTNSYSAVKNSLKKKQRLIELDFTFTSDEQLVCSHSWKTRLLTYDEFKNSKSSKKYGALSCGDVINIMASNKKMYLIVDAKSTNIVDVYSELVRLCIESGNQIVLDRVIPQVYSKEQYAQVKNIYQFKDWIFTVYRLGLKSDKQFRDIVKFCRGNGIKVITVPNSKITKKRVKILKQYKVKCFVHTINSKSRYAKLKSYGVKGIYSDKLYAK